LLDPAQQQGDNEEDTMSTDIDYSTDCDSDEESVADSECLSPQSFRQLLAHAQAPYSGVSAEVNAFLLSIDAAATQQSLSSATLLPQTLVSQANPRLAWQPTLI
jgi:hypothetical protein